jgi:hypothetical protein
MTRATVAPRAAAVLLLALGAAACTAPQGADPDEVQRWMSERDAAADVSLGVMSAPVGPADPEPGPDEGISVTYPRPERVDGVRLACLGEGTVSFTVEVTGVSSSTTEEHRDLRCGPEEHEIPLTGVAEATGVRVNAFGADRDGAWSAAVLGAEAGG